MLRLLSLVALATVLPLSPTFAHTGVGQTTGFFFGFTHPIGGVDHVLAMVAVGLFAALLGGRALWLVPAAFVTMMAVGGALGLASVNVPFVELGIGLSVVALGAAVALQVNMPLSAAMGFVGLFAIFHGHAHGSEMPETLSGLTYATGFVTATALLHFVGVGLGLTMGRLARVSQAAGGLIALTGIGIVAGLV